MQILHFLCCLRLYVFVPIDDLRVIDNEFVQAATWIWIFTNIVDVLIQRTYFLPVFWVPFVWYILLRFHIVISLLELVFDCGFVLLLFQIGWFQQCFWIGRAINSYRSPRLESELLLFDFHFFFFLQYPGFNLIPSQFCVRGFPR